MEHIKIENLSYSYENSITALQDITFSVEKGTCLCIAGANGSGKSTLLQLIGSCMKPTRGAIYIDHVSIFDAKHGGRGKTGIVFQEPDNQLFMPTVWEDVAFGVMKKGEPVEKAKESAMKALRLVDAEHVAFRPPYKLSGGEKQRAALASILIMEPDILLLDEPSAALDPRARKNIITLLKTFRCTKIIATHDLDMVLDIARDILFLHNGKIAAQSKVPGPLLDRDFLQSIGLELPLCVPMVN